MPPGPPLNLRANRISENFIEIEWDIPKFDGGSSILYYHVDISRYAPDSWTKVTKVSSIDTYCKVMNLEENMDYFFQVSAENKIGTSPYCITSKAIKTKRGLRK